MAIIAGANAQVHLAIDRGLRLMNPFAVKRGEDQAVVQWCGPRLRRRRRQRGAGVQPAVLPPGSGRRLSYSDRTHRELDEGDDGTYRPTWNAADFWLRPLNQASTTGSRAVLADSGRRVPLLSGVEPASVRAGDGGGVGPRLAPRLRWSARR